MSDPILKALAEEVSELASSPEHATRRRLWANFHALRAPRTLVNYAMYTYVWARDIAPEGSIRHAGPGLARDIEIQLRARLWKAANIPDDEPLMPTIWLPCPHPPGEDRLWGVALPARQTDDLGSYKPIPPLKEETDLGWLRFPSYEEDSVRRNQLEDEARELTGGLLPVKSHTDELHFGPFEWAVRMRGMDNLLLDVYDRPAFVHALMDFITQGMVRYHLAREAAGGVDAESSWGFHMYYDDAPPGLENRLEGCWAYVHAQSSASFSPAMYEEFVQPYNARLAELFGKIYYHGCEDLSAKAHIIKALPHLRLFHVSPWTPLGPVTECLGGSFALEVHSHPTNVLYVYDLSQVRQELRERHAGAAGIQHVLKLCDVETVQDHGQRLKEWAREARETVENQ